MRDVRCCFPLPSLPVCCECYGCVHSRYPVVGLTSLCGCYVLCVEAPWAHVAASQPMDCSLIASHGQHWCLHPRHMYQHRDPSGLCLEKEKHRRGRGAYVCVRVCVYVCLCVYVYHGLRIWLRFRRPSPSAARSLTLHSRQQAVTGYRSLKSPTLSGPCHCTYNERCLRPVKPCQKSSPHFGRNATPERVSGTVREKNHLASPQKVCSG